MKEFLILLGLSDDEIRLLQSAAKTSRVRRESSENERCVGSKNRVTLDLQEQ